MTRSWKRWGLFHRESGEFDTAFMFTRAGAQRVRESFIAHADFDIRRVTITAPSAPRGRKRRKSRAAAGRKAVSKIEDAYRAWRGIPSSQNEAPPIWKAAWDAALAAAEELCKEKARKIGVGAVAGSDAFVKLATALSSLRAGTTGGRK